MSRHQEENYASIAIILILTLATLKRFFERRSCRLGISIITNLAGVSLSSGTQYAIRLSDGDQVKSLENQRKNRLMRRQSKNFPEYDDRIRSFTQFDF